MRVMKRPLTELEDTGNRDEIYSSKDDSTDSKQVDLPEDFKHRHLDSFNEGCLHILRVDPGLRPILLSADFELFSKNFRRQPQGLELLQDAFSKLGNAIIGQQISNRAARSIRERFMERFGGEFPPYRQLYTSYMKAGRQEELRKCGLSRRKVEYLESLATYFTENEDKLLELFESDSDATGQQIVDELVQNVKGIGPWTAKMFLITGLRRYDVFAPEDVGIARGFSNYVRDKPELIAELMKNRGIIKRTKIKHKSFKWKIHDDDIMERFAERFIPYRTIFMFLLWRLSSERALDVEKEFVKIV